MKIGNIDLGNRPVFLAPMEDVTDLSFRLLCKEQGAALVYSEFVSAEALVRDIPSTVRKLKTDTRERPVAIQIYGRDPLAMVDAAKIVEESEPDIIDINFGCPVKKVAGKGAGAGMLRDIPKLLEITSAVVKAVNLPVTVKTRLGWDCENKIIHDLGLRLQDCGIAALTVHGRTRSQMYTGEADWTLIGELKNDPTMEIPVIGNGDVTCGEDALNGFDKYGVDGIMVGRGAIGAPWIFKEIVHFIQTGEQISIPTEDKFCMLLRQIHESVADKDEKRGILHIRRHLAATPLLKGLPDFRPTRIRLLRSESVADIEKIFDEIKTKYFNDVV
ncbi:MAG: tRNA dihydrouridine synthase DusB [Muribaculaceae bacterium]|nr:tRNA dihydrouridine synthase DusB [Muribaculaceae bacterium]